MAHRLRPAGIESPLSEHFRNYVVVPKPEPHHKERVDPGAVCCLRPKFICQPLLGNTCPFTGCKFVGCCSCPFCAKCCVPVPHPAPQQCCLKAPHPAPKQCCQTSSHPAPKQCCLKASHPAPKQCCQTSSHPAPKKCLSHKPCCCCICCAEKKKTISCPQEKTYTFSITMPGCGGHDSEQKMLEKMKKLRKDIKKFDETMSCLEKKNEHNELPVMTCTMCCHNQAPVPREVCYVPVMCGQKHEC